MTIATHLAQEVAETRFEDLPERAVRRIRDGILDTIGVAFLDYLLDPEAPNMIEHAVELGGGLPESTIIGAGRRVSCAFAAGVNAHLSGSADFDETGPGVHALANYVQTGVAVAERVGATGADLITAVALAYELNGRFARAAFPLGLIDGTLSPRSTDFSGHHRHYAACTAVAAARLLRLPATEIGHAIGLAWRYTAPGEQTTASGILNLGGAFAFGACVWGVQAALLARRGLAAPSESIEREGRYDLEALLESPAPYYYSAEELHLKPWIVSRGAQPGLSAALDILRDEGIRPEEIDEIHFRAKNEYMHPPFTLAEPRTFKERTNSLPWAFSMAILGHQAGPEWLAEERFADPRARALAARVRIGEDDRANEIWQSGVLITNEAPNVVEVVARGKRHRRVRTYGETLGSSLNPMPRETLARKFLANAAPVLGTDRATELVDRLGELERESDVRELAALFGTPRS